MLKEERIIIDDDKIDSKKILKTNYIPTHSEFVNELNSQKDLNKIINQINIQNNEIKALENLFLNQKKELDAAKNTLVIQENKIKDLTNELVLLKSSNQIIQEKS